MCAICATVVMLRVPHSVERIASPNYFKSIKLSATAVPAHSQIHTEQTRSPQTQSHRAHRPRAHSIAPECAQTTSAMNAMAVRDVLCCSALHMDRVRVRCVWTRDARRFSFTSPHTMGTHTAHTHKPTPNKQHHQRVPTKTRSDARAAVARRPIVCARSLSLLCVVCVATVRCGASA